MTYCDLHCHSDRSDGSCTPAELVELARGAGLAALALTDHNTVDGIAPFFRAAAGKIEVLAGCEFTTEDEGQELHLLGFFLSAEDTAPMQKLLEEQRKRKEQSNRMTVERLAAAGYALSYEEFLAFAGEGVKNRVHIARYLMSKGIVSAVQEAFDGLLRVGGGYYAESGKLDFCRTVAEIAAAGGVSVWAHPLFHVSRERCKAILNRAKPFGLDGAEVRYSTYTEEDTAFMMDIIREYRLLPSGGSDFHGANKPNLMLGTGYGNLRVPYAWYRGIRELLEARADARK